MFNTPPKGTSQDNVGDISGVPHARLAAITRRKNDIEPLLEDPTGNEEMILDRISDYETKVTNFRLVSAPFLSEKYQREHPDKFSDFSKWYDDACTNKIDPFYRRLQEFRFQHEEKEKSQEIHSSIHSDDRASSHTRRSKASSCSSKARAEQRRLEAERKTLEEQRIIEEKEIAYKQR